MLSAWGDAWASGAWASGAWEETDGGAHLPDLGETRLVGSADDSYLRAELWQRWHMNGHTVARIVEGWSDELPAWTAKTRAGDVIDLTGMDVELVITTKDKTAPATLPTLRVDDDPSTGRVYLTPTGLSTLSSRTACASRSRTTTTKSCTCRMRARGTSSCTSRDRSWRGHGSRRCRYVSVRSVAPRITGSPW